MGDLVGGRVADVADKKQRECRWTHRVRMRVPVELRGDDNHVIRATILNMTDDGILIEFSSGQIIPVNAMYTITLDGCLHCQCLPVWKTETRAGLVFSSPVHPAVVAGIARRFPLPVA